MSDYKSSDLLNAIRTGASADYQDRVPEATQENLALVGTSILDYSQARNEFTDALFNKIGLSVIKNKLFENPLREFKKGQLEDGADIEEIFVDIIKASAYDPITAETELFKRALPNISACFHRVNREDQYKTTVQLKTLRKAFTSESGFNSLVDKIITNLYTSANFDEFIIMKNLITQYAIEGKFAMIPVSPVTDNATAKSALSKIKEVSNDLTFLSSDFNHAGVSTFTMKENQIVLIDTKFDAIIDVEVLASAFNMEKADFIGRRVLVDNFGGVENVLCAIVDRDWFMCYDKEIDTDNIYNPQGKYYNYFLDVWQVMSTSLFSNAVLFVVVAPTLTAIELFPVTATVAKGKTVQFEIETTGTGNPSSKVEYTHNGTVGKTFVSSTGLMSVGKTEAVTPITVTATSVVDELLTDTALITVV